MGHFGTFLRKLRESRGLTRPQLAEAAELSVPTIQRAEASARPVFTRSNARRVFEAFEKLRPPLSREEAEQFLQWSGLESVLSQAKLMRPSSADHALAAFLDLLGDPNERSAYQALDELIAAYGSATALAAVQGMAAAFTARLQAQGAKQPLILHEEPKVEEGWEVRKMRPVEPPPEPAPPAKRRSRNA